LGDSSRTEKPTSRRLNKAREEGRFATSREFVAGVQFLVFVGLLAAFGSDCFAGLGRMMKQLIADAFQSDITLTRLTVYVSDVVLANLSSLAIMAGVLLICTLATQLMITNFGIATGQLTPDLTRLNPLGRIKSLGRQNGPAFVQAVVLLPIFAFAVWGIVKPNLGVFLQLPLASVETGAMRMSQAFQDLLWKAAFVFFLIGCFDLYRQRRRYIADLRMTHQEIREEHKELEGNPQIKGRIRRLQRDLLRRNMMKEIPNATAVVVNPTHFAVAIRYELDSMAAPAVLAKGKNYLALRIKQRAIEHNVPIVENPPLAQALYKSVDVGQEIPPHLYRAVAEVLAYIFKLTRGGRN
jgi:flagellar biosynthesis protein FlhB